MATLDNNDELTDESYEFLDSTSTNENIIQQILYISNGNIYSYDIANNTSSNLILNNDTINNFSISPSKRYLAYEKVLRYVDSPGIYDSEKLPKDPLCSIIIYDLVDEKKLCEVYPGKDEFISLSKWIDYNKLLYISNDGFSVNGWLIIETDGVVEDLSYKESIVPRSVVYSRDVSTKLYVNNSNILQMVNLKRMEDTPIYQSTNNLFDYNVSSDKKHIVFFEIINNKLGTMDRISLFSLIDLKQTEIYLEKALGKSRKSLSFSPGDSIISVVLGGNKIFLIDIFSNKKYIVDGYDVCWIDSDTFIYCKSQNIYLFNMKNKLSSLLIKNANKIEYYK